MKFYIFFLFFFEFDLIDNNDVGIYFFKQKKTEINSVDKFKIVNDDDNLWLWKWVKKWKFFSVKKHHNNNNLIISIIWIVKFFWNFSQFIYRWMINTNTHTEMWSNRLFSPWKIVNFQKEKNVKRAMKMSQCLLLLVYYYHVNF